MVQVLRLMGRSTWLITGALKAVRPRCVRRRWPT